MWQTMQQKQPTIETLEAKLADQESEVNNTKLQVEQPDDTITVLPNAVKLP